jgi:hypothetical protein
MSMLTFYINRAGRNLPPERKETLEAAKGKIARTVLAQSVTQLGAWRI